MRIVLLAEMIWNLQDMDEFDSCIAQMHTPNKIESTYAELEIARLLYAIGNVAFSFRTPTNVTAEDYDLEITYNDGVSVCADTKCKLEETDITLKTIEKSFRRAHDQMPSDRPGVIFVKIPRFWLDDERFAFSMVDSASKYFRSNRKIVSIKYYTTSIIFEKAPHGETTREIIAYQEHSNPDHRFAQKGKRLARVPR
jgi:hypothetical protein